MKRFFLPLFATFMAIAVNATTMQPQVRTVDPYSQMSDFQKKQMEAKMEAAMRESSQQVHIKLDLPEDAFLPQMCIWMYNEEYYGKIMMVNVTEREVTLPTGIYDFCCTYKYEQQLYYIILE